MTFLSSRHVFYFILFLLLSLGSRSAWAETTASVSGSFGYIDADGNYIEVGCSATNATFAECALGGEASGAWAAYGTLGFHTSGWVVGYYFWGDSYAAFTDSITVTAPTSGFLELSWSFDANEHWCMSVANVNGDTHYLSSEPQLGCFGPEEFSQRLPFSPGVAVPITASLTGYSNISNSMGYGANSFLNMEKILVLDSASRIIPHASIEAASGTEYWLDSRNNAPVPEPNSITLVALATGILLIRRTSRAAE